MSFSDGSGELNLADDPEFQKLSTEEQSEMLALLAGQ